MKTKDGSTHFRLTPGVKWLMQLLAEKLGVSRTAVIEMSVREFAKRHGVQLPDGKPGGVQ